jgi:hypothetical protein
MSAAAPRLRLDHGAGATSVEGTLLRQPDPTISTSLATVETPFMRGLWKSSKALWSASRNPVSTRSVPATARVGMQPRGRRARKGDTGGSDVSDEDFSFSADDEER